MASRHTLHLPDGRVVSGVYYPAPLRAGDVVSIDLETYTVDCAALSVDPHEGVLVTARLVGAGAPPADG